MASGCVRRTFQRPVPSQSIVASGPSGGHLPLSTSTRYKTPHPRCTFMFFAPGPPCAQGVWVTSGCNFFFFADVPSMPSYALHNTTRVVARTLLYPMPTRLHSVSFHTHRLLLKGLLISAVRPGPVR